MIDLMQYLFLTVMVGMIPLFLHMLLYAFFIAVLYGLIRRLFSWL